MSEVNLYQLLDTRPEASPEELRRDYERALAAAHRSGATKHMVELVHAYEVLSSPHRRAKYDATGRAVRLQHIGNPFGRAVPFRSDTPSLGQRSRRSVPGRTVMPPTPPARSGTTRAVVLVLVAVVVAAAVSAIVVSMHSRDAAVRTVVPGVPGRSQRQVICPTTTFWARAGQTIVCPDGGRPTWGAVRRL